MNQLQRERTQRKTVCSCRWSDIMANCMKHMDAHSLYLSVANDESILRYVLRQCDSRCFEFAKLQCYIYMRQQAVVNSQL